MTRTPSEHARQRAGGSRLSGTPFSSLLQGARHRFDAWAHARRLSRDLERLGAYERQCVLADFGLTEQELPLVAGLHAQRGDLWKQMMARLGLDPAQAEKVDGLRDLQRMCAKCKSQARCQKWCSVAFPLEGYRAFCPNAFTFDLMLRQAASKQRPGA